MGKLPADDVGAATGGEHPDVVEAQRVGGDGRRAEEALVGGQPVASRGEGEREREGLRRRGAGVRVGGDGERDAGATQRFDVRRRLFQDERGGR